MSETATRAGSSAAATLLAGIKRLGSSVLPFVVVIVTAAPSMQLPFASQRVRNTSVVLLPSARIFG